MTPNANHGGFPLHHFVRNDTQNSKTNGCIRTFYLSNDCCTISDIYSLGQSCMRDMIGKVWIQTRNTTTYRYILCILTLVTQKIQVICRRCTYRMTAILLEISIFFVRAGYETRMPSCTSKHASQSLSDKPFLRTQCTQTQHLKTSGHMWTFSISKDYYNIGDIFCMVQGCTRDPTGELRPKTRIGCSLIHVFVYCKLVSTSTVVTC